MNPITIKFYATLEDYTLKRNAVYQTVANSVQGFLAAVSKTHLLRFEDPDGKELRLGEAYMKLIGMSCGPTLTIYKGRRPLGEMTWRGK